MGLKVVEEVKIGEPAKKGDCEDRNTKHVTDSDDDDDDDDEARTLGVDSKRIPTQK